MKRIALLFVLAACGSGTTTGSDAGVDASSSDSGSDVVTNDSSDASSDVVTQTDGGLGVGDTCDPKNNQCNTGLLCCNEPTIDGGTGYLCEKPVQKQCPLLP